MTAERWPGDCGDLIDSLWYLNIERACQQAIDDTLDVIWTALGIGPIEVPFAPDYGIFQDVKVPPLRYYASTTQLL